MNTEHLRQFLTESNKIEGIKRPREWMYKEVENAAYFLKGETVTIHGLKDLVRALQPGAKLRDKPGMDVMVGSHFPPRGGPRIAGELETLLDRYLNPNARIASPAYIHQWCESLHPFTDGNGRSGRMLWLWQMVNQGHGYRPEWGFLRHFYYQSLEHGR
ncbi:MAG: Fic family protein [Nitrospinaceae bacterium]